MSAKTGIEWTDATWNPVVGCRKVSEGCRNCYAKSLHDLRHKAYHEGKKMPEQYAVPFETVQLMDERLDLPLRWKKPRRIFVNSVSDLFHPDVSFEFIDRVFTTMRAAHWHTFQVLTKRPNRALTWYANETDEDIPWPKNVWMGVSVENQDAAEERIPHLLRLPPRVRFLSCEPLLGPVNLKKYIDLLDWVIVGGESGKNARAMHADWARILRDQCQVARVPFFFKQWGEWCHYDQPQLQGKLGKEILRWDDGISLRVGVQASGHLLDGEEWRQVPNG